MALLELLRPPGRQPEEQAGRALAQQADPELDPLEAQVRVLQADRVQGRALAQQADPGLDPLVAQVRVLRADQVPARVQGQALLVQARQPVQAVEGSVACRQAPIHASGQGFLIGRGLCGCP